MEFTCAFILTFYLRLLETLKQTLFVCKTSIFFNIDYLNGRKFRGLKKCIFAGINFRG